MPFGRCIRVRIPTLAFILLTAALPGSGRLWAQRGGPAAVSRDSAGRVTLTVPRWSFWLQNSWAAAELLALAFAGYQLWARREDRRRADAESAIYQAWTVVNSAQGKGGSGGRIGALQDLNRHGVSLAGVRLDGAWLTGINLAGATMSWASFRETSLRGANLENANLEYADLSGADLTGANLKGAVLKNANLAGARLGLADLRTANLGELKGWDQIAVVSYLQLAGTREAPPGFLPWALVRGAVEQETDALLRTEESSYSQYFRAT